MSFSLPHYTLSHTKAMHHYYFALHALLFFFSSVSPHIVHLLLLFTINKISIIGGKKQKKKVRKKEEAKLVHIDSCHHNFKHKPLLHGYTIIIFLYRLGRKLNEVKFLSHHFSKILLYYCINLMLVQSSNTS